MPLSVLPGGFFYSQDLFDAAGITETPTTIDELEDAVAKLQGDRRRADRPRREGRLAGRSLVLLLRAPRVQPRRRSRRPATRRTSATPCWLKAAEDLEDFAATSPFNDGFLTTSAQQGAGSSAGLVANHQAAMELMGAWDPGVIASLTPDEKPLPDLAWFPFPEISGGEGEPGSMMGGVDGYSCSVEAPKECADFLNFIAIDRPADRVLQGVQLAAGQHRRAGGGHRAVPQGGPRRVQRCAVRLAVARHGARPERRQRAERRGRRHARRQQHPAGARRRGQPRPAQQG